MHIPRYPLATVILTWTVALAWVSANQGTQVLPDKEGDPLAPVRNIGFAGQEHRAPMMCADEATASRTAESRPIVRSSAPAGAQHPVSHTEGDLAAHPVIPRESEGKSLSRDSRATAGLSWRDGLPLALVLGVIAAMALLLRRFLPHQRLLTGSGAIEVVARTGLSSKQQLVLVKVGRRLVLLGVSAERINPLSEVVDPDEVAALMGTAAGDRPSSMRRAFADSFEREARTYAEPSADDQLVETVGGQVRGLLDKLRRHTRAREVA